MALVSDRTGVSLGLLTAVGFSLLGTVFTAGGAYVQLQAQSARLTVLETRAEKLADVDQQTALRLVRFDSALESLTIAVRDLQAEIRTMRETRVAGGRQR